MTYELNEETYPARDQPDGFAYDFPTDPQLDNLESKVSGVRTQAEEEKQTSHYVRPTGYDSK